MKTKKRLPSKIKVLVTIFILLMVFGGSNGHALNIEKLAEKAEGRFVVSPGEINLKVKPGETQKAKILVSNRLGRKTDFFVKKEALINKDDPQVKKVIQEWVKVEVDSFSLEQGDRITFDVTVKVPSTANIPSCYAVIEIGTKGNKTKGKDKVKVVSQISIPLYVEIEGVKAIKRGRLAELFTDKLIYSKGPVRITNVFENQGNVHLQPKGEVSIYNLTGAKVAQIPLKPRTVLPHSSITQEAVWNEKWLLGRYTVVSKFFYADNHGNHKATKVTVFYTFPWQIALLIALPLGVTHYLIAELTSIYKINFTIGIGKK